MHIGKLSTEATNEDWQALDKLSIQDILTVMNEEDKNVAWAVAEAKHDIARAVELVVASLKQGGRLIYIGAGTSGRLGVLDAVECPPTFSTSRETVLAFLAGGQSTFHSDNESAEDDAELGKSDLQSHNLTSKDIVVGITASGRTPYVIGGLDYARAMGAKTVAVSCNTEAEVSAIVDVGIEINTGPEVVMGSTRLKAGTAQKLVLNMLSTTSMIKLGKVYGNHMVDLEVTNAKLEDRAKRIVMETTGVPLDEASRLYYEAGRNVKAAIVMAKKQVSREVAVGLLDEADGLLRQALSEV